MSRPFFIKLLETGSMAHHRVGNQRRVYLRDVLNSPASATRNVRLLSTISRQAVEVGLYDPCDARGGSDE
jgi:hypothetical protein